MRPFVPAAALLLFSWTPARTFAQAAPKIAFEKHVLSNGLQLILHVDRKLPVVHVNLYY